MAAQMLVPLKIQMRNVLRLTLRYNLTFFIMILLLYWEGVCLCVCVKWHHLSDII